MEVNNIDEAFLFIINIGELLLNVYLVKAMVFPVVMYGCESWNIDTAEH